MSYLNSANWGFASSISLDLEPDPSPPNSSLFEGPPLRNDFCFSFEIADELKLPLSFKKFEITGDYDPLLSTTILCRYLMKNMGILAFPHPYCPEREIIVFIHHQNNCEINTSLLFSEIGLKIEMMCTGAPLIIFCPKHTHCNTFLSHT